jgi:outer membrane protein OmpA-like peptidoglycan-associated protein
MPHYSDDLLSDSSASLRHWVWPALILSLVLHGGLFYAFSKKTLDHFHTDEGPRLVPRVFSVNRVKIDQKLLDDNQSKPTHTPGKPDAQPGQVKKNLSQFDGSFENDMQELRAAPEVNTPQMPDIKEKPSVDTKSAVTAAAKAKMESAIAIDKELNDVRKQLLSDKPDVATRPRISSGNRNKPGHTDNEDVGDSSVTGSKGVPAGFSDLDDLLAGSGKLGDGTKPIMMPTDLLFDFDSANLRPGAAASLEKLGKLIERNPQSVFKVEGHTDSFGSDEYNLDLSWRRADTVKAWLVQNMGIDSGRIQTQGYGKTHLLVPASRSQEEQQLNRRVEIVIKSKKG